ncbi:MAG: tol-pal system YbgF family protein [Polyangiales bacterium]
MQYGLPRIFCVVFMLSIGAVTVDAQEVQATEPVDADTERADARELYADGADSFEAGDFQSALESFQACYELSRLPALLFNIGSSYDRLEQPAEAVRHYQAYIAAVPDADNREYVESRMVLLRASDEEDVGDEARSGPGSSGAEQGNEDVFESPSRVGPALLMAAGGASAVGAVVAGLLARSSRSDLDRVCAGSICPPEARSTHDVMKRRALVTDVLGGVAIALVVTGVVWWVIQPGEDDNEARVELGCSIGTCNARVEW